MKKIILLAVLVCMGTVVSAAAQDSVQTFTGKIEEIAMKTMLSPMGGSEKMVTLKLNTHPKLEFRMRASDATMIGLITSQSSAILMPNQVKGVGWKVTLTCEKKTTFGGEPVYLVTKLLKHD
ncbi:MAG: hypothetical protein PHU44_09730 [Syntrophales bacterium]|nr:hypothetical protein [Syntrophales bacterium]MDD5642084.1 hypothetical protein [Syntrophales bacterium]